MAPHEASEFGGLTGGLEGTPGRGSEGRGPRAAVTHHPGGGRTLLRPPLLAPGSSPVTRAPATVTLPAPRGRSAGRAQRVANMRALRGGPGGRAAPACGTEGGQRWLGRVSSASRPATASPRGARSGPPRPFNSLGRRTSKVMSTSLPHAPEQAPPCCLSFCDALGSICGTKSRMVHKRGL